MSINGSILSRSLTENQKAELLELDYEFFNSIMAFGNESFRRIDITQCLDKHYRDKLISSIVVVYCFPKYKQIVEETLSCKGLDIKVVDVL